MLMLCPICAGEFERQATDCPACGCTLVPETLASDSPVSLAPDGSRTKPKAQIEFVELCRPRLYPLALLIQQTLEQHGVIVWVHGGNVVSLMPQLAFGGELRVLVDRDQSDYARELYKAYFENDEDIDYIMEGEV